MNSPDFPNTKQSQLLQFSNRQPMRSSLPSHREPIYMSHFLRKSTPSQKGASPSYLQDRLLQHDPAQQFSGQKSRNRFHGSASNHKNSAAADKQYELVIEFELRREKQKTVILEERLKNKETFILQMKQFQDELTLAFEKCQQELIYYKKQNQQLLLERAGSRSRSHSINDAEKLLQSQRNQQYCTFNQNQLNQKGGEGRYVSRKASGIGEVPTVIDDLILKKCIAEQVRQYLEEIAELKHLVIRLQEEVNYHEQKSMNRMGSASKKVNDQQQFRSSPPLKQNRVSRKNASPQKLSTKRVFGFDLQGSAANTNIMSQRKRRQLETRPVGGTRQIRSKTQADHFGSKKKGEIRINMGLTEQIVKEKRKISSFIQHFLTMVQFFNNSNNNALEQNLKKRLKKAWKWIKSTVVQWNQLKKGLIAQSKLYRLGAGVVKIMPDSFSVQQTLQWLQIKLATQHKLLQRSGCRRNNNQNLVMKQ